MRKPRQGVWLEVPCSWWSWDWNMQLQSSCFRPRCKSPPFCDLPSSWHILRKAKASCPQAHYWSQVWHCEEENLLRASGMLPRGPPEGHGFPSYTCVSAPQILQHKATAAPETANAGLGHQNPEELQAGDWDTPGRPRPIKLKKDRGWNQ